LGVLFTNYKPIDIATWDQSGKGKNILDLLKPWEQRIWKAALPFQDKRDDQGHAEHVTYFALKLLDHIPAIREIVIPAAILHDTGWSQMSQQDLDKFYLPNWKDYEPMLRNRHQVRGVKFSRKLLEEKYQTEEYTLDHILEIISQHDTRKGFYSTEDGIVRDADKLWRYTLRHWDIYREKRDPDFVKYCIMTYGKIQEESFFFSEAARLIARKEQAQVIRIVEAI